MVKVKSLISAGLLWLICTQAAALGDRRDLEANWEKWQAADTNQYVYHYRKHCACRKDALAEVAVTVDAGTITNVIYIREDYKTRAEVPEDRRQWYSTIDDLFRMIEEAIHLDANVVDVDYHPTMGYPTRIFIDYDESTLDDEIDIRVSMLRAR